MWGPAAWARKEEKTKEKGDTGEAGASLSRSESGTWCREEEMLGSAAARTVPWKPLLTEQQRAVRLVDDSSKVNGQLPS